MTLPSPWHRLIMRLYSEGLAAQIQDRDLLRPGPARTVLIESSCGRRRPPGLHPPLERAPRSFDGGDGGEWTRAVQTETSSARELHVFIYLFIFRIKRPEPLPEPLPNLSQGNMTRCRWRREERRGGCSGSRIFPSGVFCVTPPGSDRFDGRRVSGFAYLSACSGVRLFSGGGRSPGRAMPAVPMTAAGGALRSRARKQPLTKTHFY